MIAYVIEHSPAAEAGLRKGDVIESINGMQAANLTLEEIRQMFKRRPGEELLLKIGRNGQRLGARMKLAPVLNDHLREGLTCNLDRLPVIVVITLRRFFRQ